MEALKAHGFAGGHGPWWGDLGLCCHEGRSQLYAALSGDSVADQSGSGRPAIDQLYRNAQFRSCPGHHKLDARGPDLSICEMGHTLGDFMTILPAPTLFV